MVQPDRQEWREEAMTAIGSILERNIILNGADVLTAKGYTQVSNHVLVSATSGTHTRFAEVIHWTLVMVELSTAIHWTLVMRNLDFGDD
jgi:hypothetical protein